MTRWRSHLAIRLWPLLLPLLLVPTSCDDDDDCSRGSCVCEQGDSCTLDCEAPPCHVLCEGDNDSCRGACANGDCLCGPESDCAFACRAPPCHVDCAPDTACTGVCANGDCVCGTGSRCSFECDAAPCHVTCDGNNPECNGVCANGSCACGPESTCAFVCDSGPCSATCAAGSSCILECPAGDAGSQNCRFDGCAAGTPVVCPGGAFTTCGADCPS